MTVSDQDKDLTWALTDRTLAPPQRVFARRMRKTPTDSERKPYIVDVVCHQLKLVIEIDGGQHGAQTTKDEIRIRRLNPKAIVSCGTTMCFRISKAC
jgi:very-short-patch-repair endonuclease